MRTLPAAASLCLLVAPCVLLPSCGGGGATGPLWYGDEVLTLFLENRTSGTFTHGTIRILDTGAVLPILGTPDDADRLGPGSLWQVAQVPYGATIDVRVDGHDPGGTNRTWSLAGVFVWTPFDYPFVTLRVTAP